MRRALPLCLVLLASPLLLAAQASPSRTRDATARKTKQAITTVYERMLEAVRVRDTVALSRLLTPRYFFTLSGGDSVIALSRAERLQTIAADPDSIPALNLERCDIELYGDAAVGACRIRQLTISDGSTRRVTVLITATFVRGLNRRWQVAASHASRVPTEPR